VGYILYKRCYYGKAKINITLLGLGLTVAFLATNDSYLLLFLSLMIGFWLVGIINYFNERKKYKRTEDSLDNRSYPETKGDAR